jgi:hypothetical protein
VKAAAEHVEATKAQLQKSQEILAKSKQHLAQLNIHPN